MFETYGVSIASPLGPTLAAMFMGQLEHDGLNNCPGDFKPNIYHRTVDDTLIIFKEQSQSKYFLQYLNN